jgi:hypothetical protein
MGLAEHGGLRSEEERKEELRRWCSVANRLLDMRPPSGAGMGKQKTVVPKRR